jgi:hypothetical protein
MTCQYRATKFSNAVAGTLAIAAGSTDDGGGATVCTEAALYHVRFGHFADSTAFKAACAQTIRNPGL